MPYNKDTDGKELYDPNTNYERNNGFIVYAKDQFLNEYYFTDVATNREIYRTNQDGSFTYAKNNDNKQIYAKNDKQDEYYFRDTFLPENPFDVYAQDRFGVSSYAKDKHDNQIYATDKDGNDYYIIINGKEIYAQDKNHNEKYAKRFLSKEEVYITKPKIAGQFYAKDKFGNDTYAKDSDGNEKYYTDGITYVNSYAKDCYGQTFYARDKDGSEIYLPNPASFQETYISNKAGDQVYAKNYLGSEKYQLDLNGIGIYAKKANGCEIYAKDVDGNEYYHSGEKYAKDENGTFYYAQDNLQHEIYMTDAATNKQIYIRNKYAKHYIQNFNEIYAKDKNNIDYYVDKDVFAKGADGGEKYPQIDPTKHSRYALDSHGDEFYPVWNMKNYVIGDRYAVQQGNQVYPIDGSGNDYYHQGMFAEMSDQTQYYATNAQNYILLPLDPITKEPKILLTEPKVDSTQIVTKHNDYAVTSVKFNFIQKSSTLPTSWNFLSLKLGLIIVIIQSLVIIILLIFYIRK